MGNSVRSANQCTGAKHTSIVSDLKLARSFQDEVELVHSLMGVERMGLARFERIQANQNAFATSHGRLAHFLGRVNGQRRHLFVKGIHGESVSCARKKPTRIPPGPLPRPRILSVLTRPGSAPIPIATDVSALRDLLVQLVAIPSVSRQEGPLAEFVQTRLQNIAGMLVQRVGDNVVARFPRLDGRDRILLCGHLDTVPSAAGNDTPRVEGNRVYGVGASDLKAGLAVFLELLARVDFQSCTVDPWFVFYAREEIGYSESGLLEVVDAFPGLRDSSFAVCVEPTANAVEIGCVGTLHAEVTVRGKAAHSARPWLGDNAIHRCLPLLEKVAQFPVREYAPEDDKELVFREVLSATKIHGGVAGNVIPDEVRVFLNFRFAPDRTSDDAVGLIRAFVSDFGDVDFLDLAPAGAIALDNRHCQRLIALAPGYRAKQAWTDVGRFREWGVPAVSCGPGLPEMAHQAGEYANLSDLVTGYQQLHRFLLGDSR